MKIIIAMTGESDRPDDGSFVAHCALEFDENAVSAADLGQFHRNVHAAIAACCRVIHQEVRRHAQARNASEYLGGRFNGFWPAN
jgi:hypothetical protein